MIEQIFPSISTVLTITLVAFFFGLILSIAKIKLKVEKDPRIEDITNILPNANCGACGMPGCAAYATAITNGKADINLCPVGGPELIDKIAAIMGTNASGDMISLKARVHCQGGNLETNNRFKYEGPLECSASNKIMGGFKTCEYGCLGYGDCEKACPFDAIEMSDNGLPIIILDKCTGCGKCVIACPRNIISLVPENFDVFVMCKNQEKAKIMKEGCSVGCIGCKLCEKACKNVMAEIDNIPDPKDAVPAIIVNNFIATIDYDRCTNCFECVAVCPVPVIDPIEKSKKKLRGAEKKLSIPKKSEVKIEAEA